MKRFYRDSKNDMIAGVCSGLEKYFEIDSTLWRLLFIIGAFVTDGWVVVLYILLVLLTPRDFDVRRKDR